MKLFLSLSVAALTATSALAEPNALECEVLKSYTAGVSQRAEEHTDFAISSLEEFFATVEAALADHPEIWEDLLTDFGPKIETMNQGLRELAGPSKGYDQFKLILDDRCGG